MAPLSILVIRRDNIGDLVCTTPLFQALRERFPSARIEALVNSYNAAVMSGHPSIDDVHVYTKLKHRAPGQSALTVLWRRAALLLRLRRRRFDCVIVAGRGGIARTVKLARGLRPRHIVAFADAQGRAPAGVDLPIPLARDPRHEVEETFSLLTPFAIDGEPPSMCVVADPVDREHVLALLAAREWGVAPWRIGIHISSRKPSNRWPEDRFVELIRRIHEREGAVFLLFWSPGDAATPTHPGDDMKARQMMAALGDVPVLAYPTARLEQLIAGLSMCDRVVCSDGGAMHIAAALGKPVLCFFGDSDAVRWRPWGVRHQLLQPQSLNAADISVEQALAAFQSLKAQPTGALIMRDNSGE